MIRKRIKNDVSRRRGSIFAEYILLLTIVGIGVIVGLVCVRNALVNELMDLATAIESIV
ncbi:MAG: hypothetical protein P8M30_05285 [Planctomycetaceae bacterium]|nr:hypothetical protein [Planctomycetaceae bacterium]